MSSIYENATPRPWRQVAMGGSSTVLSEAKPSRNDTRIPPYAYRDEHCVAYPFIGDRDGMPGNAGDVSLDFVCFSHADAALIVHAVNNIERLEAKVRAVMRHIPMDYLQRHDKAGATGPTEALNLEAAMKDYAEDRWKAIDRIKAVSAINAELLEAVTEILGPLNVCSDNPHVRDDECLPVDMTMGELRSARAAIASAQRIIGEGE